MVPTGLWRRAGQTQSTACALLRTHALVWPGFTRGLGPKCFFRTVLRLLVSTAPAHPRIQPGLLASLTGASTTFPPLSLPLKSVASPFGSSLCRRSNSTCFQASEPACPAFSKDAAGAVGALSMTLGLQCDPSDLARRLPLAARVAWTTCAALTLRPPGRAPTR